MAALTLRTVKGTPLTNSELDANFTALNTELGQKLVASSNLSDLANATTARTNLGLGNVENKSSATIRGELTSSNVTTALGFTPYNATNPSAYVSAAGARSALSFVAGSGAYNSTTGVITIPTNTNQLTNGAGFITGSASITGNAATATALQTARTINGVSFNGTANITIADATKLPLAGGTLDGGTNTTLTLLSDDTGASTLNLYGSSQGTGRVYVGQSATHGGGIEYNGDGTPATTGAGSDYVTLWRRSSGVDYWTARNLHSSNDWEFRGTVTAPTFSGALSGNASTATTLQTSRTINGTSFNGSANITTASWGTARTLSFTGDVTGSSSVNGSANVATAMTLANSGVTAGTYGGNNSIPSLTVDAKGRVTAASTVTPSGTWGISVSGNAATATALQTARTINGVSFNGSANITINTLFRLDNRTIAPSELNAGYMRFGFTSWANNNTAPYADFLHLRSYTDSSGGNDNLVMFRKDAIGMRIYQQTFGSATAYSSFKDVAFTDGTGASGTWGISISGNAATATALQTARTINGVSFNGSANITITAAANGGNSDTVDSLHAASFFRRDTSNSVDVRLASGDGRGVRFWDSDSYKIWMSASTNTTWGGRVAGETTSDYNIYFRIASGTNRGFVFESSYATKLFAINPNGVRSAVTVTAPTFSGALSGNASTATALQTARTIGGVSFNGTANINLPGVNTTGNQNTTGSAATLTTARTINGVSFNGSANITLPTVNTSGDQTISGTKTFSTGVTIGAGVTLKESADRADLLEITSNTSGWGGIQIRNSSSEGRWSFMTDGENAGIYNDEDNQWHIYLTETGGVDLYHNATVRFSTTSAGATVAGTLTATAFSGPLTGNASTATTLATARTINGTSFNGSANITVPRIPSKGTLSAETLRSVHDTGIYTFNSNNVSLGGSTPTSYWSTLAWGNGAGGSAELAVNWTSSGNEIWFRSLRNTTDNWWAWKEILHSSNYTDYTVTKTGTGASGTWGISITGNAATATALQTARTINGVSFNGTANITITSATLTTARLINGTSFNGSANITTARWGTSRTLTIGATGKSVNGSANVAWTLAEITGTTAAPQFGSLGIGTAASGTTGEIRATNNITAYYSDDRLKTRLGRIEGALDKLCSLEGFYYEANETAQALGYKVKREVGVSAQQIQAVMPEIVAPAPIDEQYLTVRYERALPLVIEAIKELRADVARIKKLAGD